MSSAEGPVRGITSSSASAIMIGLLQNYYSEVGCPSGVLFKIDVVGEREKSLSTDAGCNFKHMDGTRLQSSPLTDMWHLDSSLLQYFP